MGDLLILVDRGFDWVGCVDFSFRCGEVKLWCEVSEFITGSITRVGDLLILIDRSFEGVGYVNFSFRGGKGKMWCVGSGAKIPDGNLVTMRFLANFTFLAGCVPGCVELIFMIAGGCFNIIW